MCSGGMCTVQSRAEQSRAEQSRAEQSRAEQYIKAYPDKRLKLHTEHDVARYLTDLGRTQPLKAWQFHQSVDALRILFQEFLDLDWAESFNWPFWLESSQTLEKDHPTVARYNYPVTVEKPVPVPEDDEAASPFPDIIQKMIIEIRLRQYSIRTEQAYVGWINRFIRFHQSQDPSDMGEKEIEMYISYLAVERNVSVSTQGQAMSALVFLYKHILEKPLGTFSDYVKAKRAQASTYCAIPQRNATPSRCDRQPYIFFDGGFTVWNRNAHYGMCTITYIGCGL